MTKNLTMSSASLLSKNGSCEALFPSSRSGKYSHADEDDDAEEETAFGNQNFANSNEVKQEFKAMAKEIANGTKRRPIGDQTLRHRVGPAPVSDRILKVSIDNTAPGSLDSDMEDLDFDNERVKSKAGCKGLLMYFSKLGKSAEDSNIDFTFIESLLNGGADINFRDRHGQCALHEISRGWNLVAADFAKMFGADVNSTDRHGRTPLHLASAVNHHQMVKWLVENGSLIDAKTRGENQTPIHYAAKNNAVDALKVLLKLGADIGSRDYKSRTPLFVAAETGRSEACRFLLEQGAPAGVYDDGGTSALTLMVEKMPDVAKIALGQFQMVDKALRKKFYYLNYLETDVWRRMATREGKALRMSYARTPLETICIYNENDLIMHPVILRLIAIKWQLFGKYHSILTTAINLIYTLLWTTLGVTLPKTKIKNYYTPVKENMWRTVLEVISCGMSLVFLVMQVLEFRRWDKRDRQYKEWRTREVERDLQYCHPRWPEERRYLNSEMDLIRSSSLSYLKNGWNIFEWVAFSVILLVICTRIASCLSENPMADNIHYRAFLVLLIFLWLRFMKCCRCYQSLGPFITMLGHVIADTMKFAFLFFEFFIPYVCAFWILFGGIPNSEFKNINDLIYQVFLMTLVANFEPDPIMRHDKVMTQILIGTYMAIASVVCLNLYIALMSETFNRVYSNATATAYMLQANHLLNIERSLGRKQRNRVKRFMATECSPQVIYDTGSGDDEGDEAQRLLMYRMNQGISEIRDRLMTINNYDEKKSDDGFSLQKVSIEIEQFRRKQIEQDNMLASIKAMLENILSSVSKQHERDLNEEMNVAPETAEVAQDIKGETAKRTNSRQDADFDDVKVTNSTARDMPSSKYPKQNKRGSFNESEESERTKAFYTPSQSRREITNPGLERKSDEMAGSTRAYSSNVDKHESDNSIEDPSDAEKTYSNDDSSESAPIYQTFPSQRLRAATIEQKTRRAKNRDEMAKPSQRSAELTSAELRSSTLPRNTSRMDDTRQPRQYSTLPKKVNSLLDRAELRPSDETPRLLRISPAKSVASMKGSPLARNQAPQIRASHTKSHDGLTRSREDSSRKTTNELEETVMSNPDHILGDYELAVLNGSIEEGKRLPRQSSSSRQNSSDSRRSLTAEGSSAGRSRSRHHGLTTSPHESKSRRTHVEHPHSRSVSNKKINSLHMRDHGEEEGTPLFGSADEFEEEDQFQMASSRWNKRKSSFSSIDQDIDKE